MAERQLGAAVIGTGFGFLTHARALREADIRVEALVGRDPKKTAERARRGQIPHALTSLDEALRLPGVDLVTIATPPHTHAEIAIRACEAGKHVMCEKPFAADLGEAERMLAAAERAGVVHTMGAEFRYASGQALATRALQEGVVGEPRLASFVLLMPALADPKAEVPAWWGDAGEGGGWLGAYASHVIDQTRTMLGEWRGLSASLDLVSDRDWSAEDTFTVHFKTQAGCTGLLHSSIATYGPPTVASRISGPKGTLTIAGDAVQVTDAAGTRALEMPPELAHPAPKPPDSDLLVTAYDMLHSAGIDLAPFAQLFRGMREAILGRPPRGVPSPATFADGVALQRILDAVRRASEQESWETL
jgi:predicted dehydrogenase